MSSMYDCTPGKTIRSCVVCSRSRSPEHLSFLFVFVPLRIVNLIVCYVGLQQITSLTFLMQSNTFSSSSKISNLGANGFSTEDDSRSSHDQVCCLIDSGGKCQRQAGNASYSKRIQNQARKLKLNRDEMSPHIYICDYHKSQIQNIRTKRKRKDSEDDQFQDGADEIVEIDFYQMPVNTLRRYKRYYKLPTRPGLSKAQLADAVASHFKTIPVLEKETLQLFFYTTKTKKFDNKDST